MSIAAQIRDWVAEAVSAALAQFDERLKALEDKVEKLEAKLPAAPPKTVASPSRSTSAPSSDKPPVRTTPAKPSGK